MTRNYRTFTRRATNWEQFSKSRKHAVDRNLTLDEARRACAAFNDHRTAQQVADGVKMEFETQD